MEPLVLYCREGDQARCATWRLAQGPLAVALFLTEASAEEYRRTTGLDASWRPFRPRKPDLLAMFRACQIAGISYAVLEPSLEQSKRMFDIGWILQAGQFE